MMAANNNTFATGRIIEDKWVILESLGKGGMGEVYLAHQLNLDRRVAIKVISKEWMNSLENDDEAIQASVARFQREVQIMAQVRHPNVLQIQDHGTLGSLENECGEATQYIVMEYAPGGNLRATMSDEGFYPDEDRTRNWLKRYFLPLMEGVKALHEAGVIHRDLKPENVLLCENVPKIADFGLARSARFKPITRSIEMQGTPFYMSPEHFLDLKRTDERTDIYALGKLLYEAIAGKEKTEQVPFKKASLARTETDYFQKLDLIIQNATHENREERWPTVQAFIDNLKGLVFNETFTDFASPPDLPSRRSHWRPLLFTAAFVLTASTATGLGTYVYDRTYHSRPVHNSPAQQDALPAESAPDSPPSIADQAPIHPSDIAGTTTRTAAPSEAISGANIKDDDVSHVDATSVAPVPKQKATHSGRVSSKVNAGKHEKRVHSVPKAQSRPHHRAASVADSSAANHAGIDIPADMPSEQPRSIDPLPEAAYRHDAPPPFPSSPWRLFQKSGTDGTSGSGGGC